jgi:mono/diheme cytochrome c family protein
MSDEPKPIEESPSVSQSIELDVQAIHEPLMRENTDPRDGFEPVPFWMAIIFAGLLFWGGLYMGANSGDFRFDVYDSPTPLEHGNAAAKPDTIPKDEEGLKALGKMVYFNCVGCHQPTGQGGSGIPPLAGSDWVAGDKASTARLTRILLYGLKEPIFVNGVSYNAAMPAWGGQLKDHQVAAVLTYVRKEWNNAAPAVYPEEVAAAREKMKGRPVDGSQSMTQKELELIPLEYEDVKRPDPKEKDAKKDPPK